MRVFCPCTFGRGIVMGIELGASLDVSLDI